MGHPYTNARTTCWLLPFALNVDMQFTPYVAWFTHERHPDRSNLGVGACIGVLI